LLAIVVVWVILGLPPFRRHEEAPTPPPEPPVSAEIPRITRFLAGGPIRRQPAWSPAGDFIAYVSDEAGKDDIWICDALGANPKNLTAGSKASYAHPAWSPGGTKIAFYSDSDGGGIFTMPALGGAPRKLLRVKPAILYTFSLTWHKGGKIVYTNFDNKGKKQVYAITEDNPKPQCLTAEVGKADGHFGELSPSGDLLAFLDPGINLTAGLFVGNLRSGTSKKLEQGVGVPHWDPQGKRLFFISGRQGGIDLWSREIDPRTGAGVGPARRVTMALDLNDFTFSPDGKKAIAAVKSRSQSRLWSFPTNGKEFSDLAAGTPLTSGFIDGYPSWTTDGKELLFSSNRRGDNDLWKLVPGKDPPEQVTASRGNKEHPAASPDGRWIDYTLNNEQGEYLHMVRANGTGDHLLSPRLADEYAAAYHAAWSPDGKRLAAVFETKRNRGLIGIADMDAETGTSRGEIKLLDLPYESPHCPRWSPDGKFLAYEAMSEGNWQLWVCAPDGSNRRRITNDPLNERTAAWSHEGDWLYFIKDQSSVWRLPMGKSATPTGPAQRWAEFPKTKIAWDSLAVTKDQVVIAITEEASDLWLVEFPEK
jgi:Tol biopolymer transport system component